MSGFKILFILALRMNVDAKVAYPFKRFGHVAYQIHTASGKIFFCIIVMFFNFLPELIGRRVGILGTT